jgi:thioredoxin 1
MIRGLKFDATTGNVKAKYDGGIYTLEVTISGLPDPQNGDYYEVRLVQKSPFKFISTGMLVKTGNTYTDTFTSTTDYRSYAFYVLTLQPSFGYSNSVDIIAEGDVEIVKDESKMMKPTGYMDYDEMKVSDALASGQKVALFFHATWCPTCKALEKNINAEISTIPTDTLIVKVDYDTSTEMKKKYGVTTQHTTVLIDRDMNLLSKKLGARNIGEVLN